MHHTRFLIGLLLAAGAASAQSAICRAAPAGDAAANGSDWSRATTLSAALANPACTEIWLQQGLYRAPGYDGFAINHPLHLYGGFRGHETLRTQRGVDSQSTVLSGDVAGDDAADAHGIVRSVADIVNDPLLKNAAHVVAIGGTGWPGNGVYTPADTVIDGLTITAGYANFSSGFEREGGGLLCNAVGAGTECSPRIANVSFIGNYAGSRGGALAVAANGGGIGSPEITHSLFTANQTGGAGSALAFRADQDMGVSGQFHPRIAHSTFDGNTAPGGGAVFAEAVPRQANGSVEVAYSTLVGNTSNPANGSIFHGTVTATFSHSILWGDGVTDRLIWAGGGPLGPLAGNVVQGGCTMVSGACNAATIETADPQLGPLQDNRGPTWTRVPAGASALRKFTCGPGLTDQRGAARPTGGDACDTGAVQTMDTAPAVPPRVSTTGNEVGQITVGWDAPPGAVDYEVVDVTGGAPVPVCRTAGRECVLPGLGAGETRHLEVRVFNEHGASAPVAVSGTSASASGPAQPAAVPTLSPWALALLVLGVFALQRFSNKRKQL
jgi:predicted outer membrane repeat protein